MAAALTIPIMKILLGLLGWEAGSAGIKWLGDKTLGNPAIDLQKEALAKELEEKKNIREAATTLRKSELERQRKIALSQIASQALGARSEVNQAMLSNPNVGRALGSSLTLDDILGVKM